LVLVAAATLVGAIELARAAGPQATSSEERLHKIISNHSCPCGCGNALPGGDRPLACFGCSVAKAEISFIRESLAGGLSTIEIVMALSDPALIEVFSDYTNPQLGATWKRAKRIASEFDQHRVVLRTPARTAAARRALELVECARKFHRFSSVRDALIEHSGPWDTDTLLSFAEQQGLARDPTRQCLGDIEVSDQIAKDRQHIDERKIRRFPAVSVNRTLVVDSPEAIRSEIRKVLLGNSF
jgi:protein-disulfide isomerase